MRIDSKWFKSVITESRFGSQRRLCRRLVNKHGRPMDVAMLCMTLSGKRRMQFAEAKQLATLLEVPLAEVLERAGLRGVADVSGLRMIISRQATLIASLRKRLRKLNSKRR